MLVINTMETGGAKRGYGLAALSLGAVVIAVAPVLVLTVFDPQYSYDELAPLSVFKYYSLLISIQFYGALVLFVVVATITAKEVKSPFKWVLWALLIFLFPPSCVFSVLAGSEKFEYESSAVGYNGDQYYFLSDTSFPGNRMAIAKLKKKGVFFDQFDVLAKGAGDPPWHYLYIVRPAGSSARYGQVHLSKTGWVLGIRSENKLDLAYNEITKKRYVYSEIENLSPFLLLDKDSRLEEADIESLLEIGIGGNPGQPRESRVKEALEHPNPHVKALAKKLLEKHRSVQK